MATFELYDRMVQSGGSADGFDRWPFLSAIYTRADRQLNGYFYPEYAMYMENPPEDLGHLYGAVWDAVLCGDLLR